MRLDLELGQLYAHFSRFCTCFLRPKQLLVISRKTIGDNIMSECYTSDLGLKENP